MQANIPDLTYKGIKSTNAPIPDLAIIIEMTAINYTYF